MSTLEQPSKRIKPSAPLEQYAEAVADALEDVWNGRASPPQQLQLFDDQVVWHDSLLPRIDLVGLDSLQGLVGLLRGAIPDLSLRLGRPLHSGEDGVVLGYWRASGSQTGALGPSLQPTGANAAWEGSVVVRTAPSAAPPPAAGGGAAAEGTAAEGEAAEGAEGEAAEGAVAVGGTAVAPLRGVEVWWSWDPIFLFRQLGWKEEPQRPAEAEVDAEGAVAPAAAAADVAETNGGANGAGRVDDLAARTAAAARAAFSTEAEAAEAAAAAVTAAAAEAKRLAESGGSLAAVQAANRRVVELYFHTYNTGHYAVLDHIVHPDYQYDGLLDLGGKRGRAAMAAMMGGWRDCLPDLAIGHELFVAVGGDKVTFRWVIRGTHSAPGSRLLGQPARGSPLHVKGVTTLTLRGGRIFRKVSHANAAHTLEQLGAGMHPDMGIRAPPTSRGGKEVQGEVQLQQ